MEIEQKQLDPMAIETLLNDLTGDYSNWTVSDIGELLGKDLEEPGVFYDLLPEHGRYLLTPKEYILKQCESDQVSYPEYIPQELLERMNALEGLVAEMRYSLAVKKEVEEIYAIMRRFKTEGGIGHVHFYEELEYFIK